MAKPRRQPASCRTAKPMEASSARITLGTKPWEPQAHAAKGAGLAPKALGVFFFNFFFFFQLGLGVFFLFEPSCCLMSGVRIRLWIFVDYVVDL